MRFLLISLLAVLLVNIVQAQDYFDTTDDYKEEFKGEKVTLGKKKCTCSFMLEVDGDKCSGKGGCDKKCSGSGSVEIGRYSFTLKVKKGKATISKCKAEVESTPLPTTGGSGSGEEPITMPPAPGSGSGSGPSPPMGEGMQCRCKCNCPDGSGECDCDCNCPMQSTAMTCASGFTRVCPMVEDACPEDMDMICPMNAASRMGGAEADGTVKGCQCVPDFLMSLVSPGMPPAAVRLGATDREAVEASIKVGKTQCKCSFDMAMDGLSCKKSKGRCDKKCNGAAKGVELMDGMYMLDMKVKKGKVTIAKCEVTPIALTGTGTGSGTGSGEGAGGMGGMGSRCACVGKGMGGSGPPPPTGSGSGPVPPTGGTVLPTGGPVLPTGGPVLPTEGPVPPTGTGSGSGNCPRERPEFNSPCDSSEDRSRCEYGNQTCCGETFPDFVMECMEDTWAGVQMETPCFFQGHSCGPVTILPPQNCICPEIYEPVCGTNGQTYSNTCFARCEAQTAACIGECPCTSDCICPAVFSPVCGADGQTYSNSCQAGCVNAKVDCEGECPCSSDCICPAVFSPVCGADGQTYSNACEAGCANTKMACEGECPCTSDCICPAVFTPVCGADGQTYSNACQAGCANAGVGCEGECPCA